MMISALIVLGELLLAGLAGWLLSWWQGRQRQKMILRETAALVELYSRQARQRRETIDGQLAAGYGLSQDRRDEWSQSWLASERALVQEIVGVLLTPERLDAGQLLRKMYACSDSLLERSLEQAQSSPPSASGSGGAGAAVPASHPQAGGEDGDATECPVMNAGGDLLMEEEGLDIAYDHPQERGMLHEHGFVPDPSLDLTAVQPLPQNAAGDAEAMAGPDAWDRAPEGTESTDREEQDGSEDDRELHALISELTQSEPAHVISAADWDEALAGQLAPEANAVVAASAAAGTEQEEREEDALSVIPQDQPSAAASESDWDDSWLEQLTREEAAPAAENLADRSADDAQESGTAGSEVSWDEALLEQLAREETGQTAVTNPDDPDMTIVPETKKTKRKPRAKKISQE